MMSRRTTLAPTKFPSSSQRSSSLSRQTLSSFPSKASPQVRSVSLVKNLNSQLSNAETKLQLDKAQLNNFFDNIFLYLTTHNFDKNLSLKLLKQPSSKTFISIFEYLLVSLTSSSSLCQSSVSSLLPPSSLAPPTLEEKVFGVVRALGYPFNLGKATLIAMSAPHSWPHLIGFLSWLVDINKIKMECFKNKEKDITGEENYQKMIEIYTLQTYNMKENEKFIKTDELIQRLRSKNDLIEVSMQDFENKIEKIKSNIKSIKENQPDLAVLETKISSLASNILFESEHRTSLERQVENLTNRIDAQNKMRERSSEEIMNLNAEKNKIKEKIMNQPMSRREEEELRQEVERQEEFRGRIEASKIEKMDMAAGMSGKIGEAIMKNEVRLSDLKESLKKHQEIFTLFSALIKDPDSNYFKKNLVDLEQLNPLSIKETVKEIWKIDFKRSILPKINEVIDRSNKNREKIEENLKNLQTESIKIEESNKDYEELNRKYKENIKKNQTEIQMKTEVLEKEQKKYNERLFHSKLELEKTLQKMEEMKKEMEKNKEIFNDLQNKTLQLTKEYENCKKEVEIMKKQDINRLLMFKNEMIETFQIIAQNKSDYLKLVKSIVDE